MGRCVGLRVFDICVDIRGDDRKGRTQVVELDLALPGIDRGSAAVVTEEYVW